MKGTTGVSNSSLITAAFSVAMNSATINTTTFTLRDSLNNLVPATVTYNGAARTTVLTPSSPLASSSGYTATIRGGTSGVKDVAGHPLAGDYSWSFSTARFRPDSGPRRTDSDHQHRSNPFTRYYAEILRAEGLNAFSVQDLSTVTPSVLSSMMWSF